jgi:nucleoid-associated protein YgaU
MKAGLIGAVALGGAFVAALTGIYLSRDLTEPPGRAAAPSGRIAGGQGASAGPGVPAPQPGVGPQAGTTGGRAASAPQAAGRAAPAPDRLATAAPEAPAPAAVPPRRGDRGAPAPNEPSAEAPAAGVEAPGVDAPAFDVVRVDADGQTVIAGRAAPNERIEVLLDGRVVETLLADAGGRFVAIVAAGPSSQARELRLRVALPAPPRGPARPASEPLGIPPGQSSDAAALPGVPRSPVPALPGAAPPSDLARAGPAAPGAASPGRPAGMDGPAERAASTSAAGGAARAELPSPTGEAGTADGAAYAPTGETAAPAAGPAARSPELTAASPTRPAGAGDSRYALSDPVIILPSMRAGEAPALVQAQEDGLAMLQPGGGEASGVVLDQVTQEPDGDLLLRGRARPGHAVRIYGNGRAIDTVTVADGGWSLAVPAARAEDIRLFRLDEIGRSGAVATRVEVPFEPSGPAAQVVRDRSITVQRGDNLWRIAEQHYGDGIRYSLIFGANSELIRDPDLIYPEQIFTIPELVEAE